MRVPHWLRPLVARFSGSRPRPIAHPPRFRPQVEKLEDRVVPAGRFAAFAAPLGSGPDAITTGPDGAIWFTETTGGAVGRIEPSADPSDPGAVQQFPIANLLPAAAGYTPQAIIAGPDRPDGTHTVWFSLLQFPDPAAPNGRPGNALVVEISTQGTVLGTYSLPAGTEPRLACVPQRNTVWFDDYWGITVGEIAPVQGVVGTIQVDTGSGVGAILPDFHDGRRRIWFAESYPYGKLMWADLPANDVPINPANVAVHQYTGVTQYYQYQYYPYGVLHDLTFGPAGYIWTDTGGGAKPLRRPAPPA